MSFKQNTSQASTQIATGKGIEVVEMKKGNKKDDRTVAKATLDNKHTAAPKQTTIDAQARDWFRSLSSEERSGATRFSDQAFLGTFLALSKPWLTSSTTASSIAARTAAIVDDHVGNTGAYKILCRFYVQFPGLLVVIGTPDRRSALRLEDGSYPVSCATYCAFQETPYLKSVQWFNSTFC